jgi:DNA modification methylase
MQRGSNAANQGTPSGGKSIHEAVVAASNGFAYPSNVLSVGKNREALGHGAAFPVGLPAFFIQAYSDEEDLIFEPFAGSGSTLISAHQINRRSFNLEISPKYCDVIIERWEAFTGKKAELERGRG